MEAGTEKLDPSPGGTHKRNATSADEKNSKEPANNKPRKDRQAGGGTQAVLKPPRLMQAGGGTEAVQKPQGRGNAKR